MSEPAKKPGQQPESYDSYNCPIRWIDSISCDTTSQTI